jgi:hypothetical protein
MLSIKWGKFKGTPARLPLKPRKRSNRSVKTDYSGGSGGYLFTHQLVDDLTNTST